MSPDLVDDSASGARATGDPPLLAWTRRPAHTPRHPPQLQVRERFHPGELTRLLTDSGQRSLFGGDTPGGGVGWYQHPGWVNRIIAGEAATMMRSLLTHEQLSGSVQMIYFDPPYGIGHKAQLATGPSGSVRAFRDSYERGVQTYLDLVHEQLILMWELLADCGSMFMQIGDANVHRAALLLDEVFGAGNRVATIPYVTAGSSVTKTLPCVADYLLWYAKDRGVVKYRQLYEQLDRRGVLDLWTWAAGVELADGTCRSVSVDERADPDAHLPAGARLYGWMPLVSPVTSGPVPVSEPYLWNGREWRCPPGYRWSVSVEGLDRLAQLGRLGSSSGDGPLRWKRYENELPGRRVNNVWHRPMRARDKRFVVQTADAVIERCVLMASDPGDLIFDPTCGAATTAVAAERWGRRWITCDTSPVAAAVARQRLACAAFESWLLVDSAAGARAEAVLAQQPPADPPPDGWRNDPAAGFVLERVAAVSAKTLAYGLDPEPVLLVDQPRRSSQLRVAGPFTVEAAHPAAATSEPVAAAGQLRAVIESTLPGRDLGGLTINELQPWPDPDTAPLIGWQASGHDTTGVPRRAAVAAFDETVTAGSSLIAKAIRQAGGRGGGCDAVIVAAFAFDVGTACDASGMRVVRLAMHPDLVIAGLATEAGHEPFAVVTDPAVTLVDHPGERITVEVPAADTTDDVACLLIDTDYDGEIFHARMAQFPGSDDPQIKRLLARVGRRADSAAQEALTAARSAPFPRPDSGRIAVKVIDRAGIETGTVIDLSGRTGPPEDGHPPLRARPRGCGLPAIA